MATIAVGNDQCTEIWDIVAGDQVTTLRNHRRSVRCVCFSPCGQWLATGSDDCTVVLYNSSTWEVKYVLCGHTESVVSLCFNHNGEKLLSSTCNGELFIWSTAEGANLNRLEHVKSFCRAAFDARGERVIVAATGILFFDCATGDLIRAIPGILARFGFVKCSSDNQLIASFCQDTVYVWDYASLLTLPVPQIKLSDRNSPARRHEWLRHSEPVTHINFSIDSALLVSCCVGCIACVWSMSTGEKLRSFHAAPLDRQLMSVCFAQDGSKIISGGKEGCVRVWCCSTGEELKTLRSENRNAYSIACLSITGSYI